MKLILITTLLLSMPLIADEEALVLAPAEIEKIQSDYEKMATEPGSVMFDPPAGWKMADPKVLSKYVKIMVVGEMTGAFPPSINLAFDPFKGTMKGYLKMVKSYNESQGADWKDLGTITVKAGNASLSQVDTKTKWGVERQMQVIFLKDDTAWILTCSALKDEFSKYYKDFFEAIKSLRVNALNLNTQN